ncbi:hypothetical protein GGTG_01379 [Gaeumannomyces tritici R3-111a-1]|uniref:Uncharacterized protein n=1 Tax=Gaeumannomyces tritici (strain R3-111a-1) TaxID=644352 RepID=J3NJE7_GAET3|nr:hypothetical protein GGTG_01379 [Gaeumannomyces tritici R3-111a-1]EJT81398.1 hypothetical protein GGTG_01379 [Gaeumannomyces tritici R3-111a-1]
MSRHGTSLTSTRPPTGNGSWPVFTRAKPSQHASITDARARVGPFARSGTTYLCAYPSPLPGGGGLWTKCRNPTTRTAHLIKQIGKQGNGRIRPLWHSSQTTLGRCKGPIGLQPSAQPSCATSTGPRRLFGKALLGHPAERASVHARCHARCCLLKRDGPPKEIRRQQAMPVYRVDASSYPFCNLETSVDEHRKKPTASALHPGTD